MQAIPPVGGANRYRLWLYVLLLFAVTTRLALVAGGGQFFFGDESRYERGVGLYRAIRQGNLAEVRATLGRPEHAGFTLLGAGITALQHLSAQFTAWGDWNRPENVIFSYPLGAAWLSLFSALNIWLVHRIARRSGATDPEALWAALLMACSNTGFYYARHFLPYDAALSIALAGVLVGLNPRHSLLCGLIAGASYHVYNGYWYLVPVVVALHTWGSEAAPRGWLRLAVAGSGAVAGVTIPIVVGIAAAPGEYWQTMLAFSRTVNQGLYREGWSLPWEYFWHSEGLLGGAICAAIIIAFAVRTLPARDIDRRAWMPVAALTMSYGLLVLFSTVLEKFVVYARTVKPLVPFFCLAGGWAANRLLHDRPRGARFIVAACCLAAVLNFAPHFGRVFPAEVEQRLLRDIGNPKHSLSVSGSLYIPLALAVSRPDLILVNAQLLYPVRDPIGYPAGETILRLEHPLTYPPFQYESHNPRERTLLRTEDISIRLIRLADPAAVPDDLPVSLRYTSTDRPDGHRL